MFAPKSYHYPFLSLFNLKVQKIAFSTGTDLVVVSLSNIPIFNFSYGVSTLPKLKNNNHALLITSWYVPTNHVKQLWNMHYIYDLYKVLWNRSKWSHHQLIINHILFTIANHFAQFRPILTTFHQSTPLSTIKKMPLLPIIVHCWSSCTIIVMINHHSITAQFESWITIIGHHTSLYNHH